MEKKYYFRGLGLGIIVTAVIMGVALQGGGKKVKMTDDEVIARAKELGMIEDSRLLERTEEDQSAEGQGAADVAPAQVDHAVKKDDPVKKDIAAAKEKEETEDMAAGTQDSLQPEADEAADTAKPVDAEKPKADAGEDAGQKSSENKPSADTNEMRKQDEDVRKPETSPSADGAKSVTISSGDGSYTVAKKLADAGAVRSAESYDEYLCANGYDKKLRPGTFKIPEGANDEQIARIVTGQE